MKRYEAIPHRYWRNAKTGATASAYGAAPYKSAGEAQHWRVFENGWTIRDNVTGNVGSYACPSGSSKEHAENMTAIMNRLSVQVTVPLTA